jgi:glycosyltransferase involved in cell wall biosynthesis
VRILVLTFYYRPDLSAGSFRVSALVDDLRAIAPPGTGIDVVTTLPNRYHSFSVDAPEREETAGVSIRRIKLSTHKSGMVDQSRAFLTFQRGAMRAVSKKQYDVVFATSSRLMTAALGARIARRVRAPLYLDIRDIFVDTIKDVSPRVSTALEPIFSMIERRTIQAASTVNLVSPGFAEYFRHRYPAQRFTCFTNGIDDEFVAAAATTESSAPRDPRHPIEILYAGNIGEGQGLQSIIPQLASRMGESVRFTIIGDGGRRVALELAIAALGVTNVELRPPIGRSALIDAYRSADILFLHLNDYDAFKKVLPSKIFEYAAMGKPILAGIAGYSATFVRTEVENAGVFAPCDVEGAIRAFDSLTLRSAPRTEFLAKYGRAEISRRMAEDILAIAADRR